MRDEDSPSTFASDYAKSVMLAKAGMKKTSTGLAPFETAGLLRPDEPTATSNDPSFLTSKLHQVVAAFARKHNIADWQTALELMAKRELLGLLG